MDDLLRERGYRLDFPLELVKYGQYSPRSTEKSRSAPHPLATAPILGQPHIKHALRRCFRGIYFRHILMPPLTGLGRTCWLCAAMPVVDDPC